MGEMMSDRITLNPDVLVGTVRRRGNLFPLKTRCLPLTPLAERIAAPDWARVFCAAKVQWQRTQSGAALQLCPRREG